VEWEVTNTTAFQNIKSPLHLWRGLFLLLTG
jgi:hypothetical protein